MPSEFPYRFEVATLEGLVQQLAQSHLPNGYVFYVLGRIPESKDPRSVDQKFLARYGIAVSKFVRARRKRAGLANVHYLRLGQTFVLLASHGRHPIFEIEKGVIRDARETPIKIGGYAVSFRGGHGCVRIDRPTFNEIKSAFLQNAVHRTSDELRLAFLGLPFEPYAPIRWQLSALLKGVNRLRKSAGLEPVSGRAIRQHRRLHPSLKRSEADSDR